MKSLASMAAFAVMLGGAAACATTNDAEYASPPPAQIVSTELSGSDIVFLTGAAREAALLVRLSEMAKGRAVTPEVQALAAAVWKEQTDTVRRLKDLAGRKQVQLPEESDGQGKKLMEKLAKLKGQKFDKCCLDAMADAQDILEAALVTGAGSADGDLKAFAQAGIGTLKAERGRARKLGM